MNEKIKLKRPDMGIGDVRELSTCFSLTPFDLYGRHHEVIEAEALARVTKLAMGLHLDLEVECEVETSCDRTLEPTRLTLVFGESEFLPGPNDRELYVEDWEFDVARYAREALPSEVPMQVFCPGSKPVNPEPEEGGDDPRWRGLGDLFASGF
jgi:uncharacterized protein